MITALCNIFINSEEKFSIFKETFPLVYPVSDNWLIYIRGKYRKEAMQFIIKNHKYSLNNCEFFNNLYVDNWIKSTIEMLKMSRYQYIYIYLEDHFLLKSIDYFRNVISDAIKNKVDYFQYSAHKIGIYSNNIESISPDFSEHFSIFRFSKNNYFKIRYIFPRFYPFALISVSKIDYFNKILAIENKVSFTIPPIIQTILEKIGVHYPTNRKVIFFLNKLLSIFKLKLCIYPLSTPFNTERSLYDIEKELLPIRIGVLREELFANWDDDNGSDDSSMIKRGLYPLKLKYYNKTEIKYSGKGKSYNLPMGKESKHKFYLDIPRQKIIPVKYIKLIEGKISVSSNDESYVLFPGEAIEIAANIEHIIYAYLESKYIVKLKY